MACFIDKEMLPGFHSYSELLLQSSFRAVFGTITLFWNGCICAPMNRSFRTPDHRLRLCQSVDLCRGRLCSVHWHTHILHAVIMAVWKHLEAPVTPTNSRSGTVPPIHGWLHLDTPNPRCTPHPPAVLPYHSHMHVPPAY